MASREGKAAAGLQSLAVHVGVRVVEAGAHRRAFEVDDARRMAATGKHLGGGPQRRDDPGGGSDCLRRSRSGVEGKNVTVVQNEIVLAHVGASRFESRDDISQARGRATSSGQFQFREGVAPVHTEDIVDVHACRIATDAQGQRLGEVPGESGQITGVSFVDAFG